MPCFWSKRSNSDQKGRGLFRKKGVTKTCRCVIPWARGPCRQHKHMPTDTVLELKSAGVGGRCSVREPACVHCKKTVSSSSAPKESQVGPDMDPTSCQNQIFPSSLDLFSSASLSVLSPFLSSSCVVVLSLFDVCAYVSLFFCASLVSAMRCRVVLLCLLCLRLLCFVI